MIYEVVIFDLDGTLIDSSEGIIKTTEDTLDILGYPRIPHCEIKTYIGPPIGRAIMKRNGLNEDDLKRFNAIFREVYKKYLMSIEVYPGVIELLSDLSSISIVCIATNKREDYTNILLGNLDLSVFCHFICGQNIEGSLSKEDIIRRCIELSGVNDLTKIVVVGDTHIDASAAKDCGVDFIGVTFGFGFQGRTDITYGRAADDIQSLRYLLLN